MNFQATYFQEGGENGSVSNDNGEEIADAVVRGVVWGRKKSQPWRPMCQEVIRSDGSTLPLTTAASGDAKGDDQKQFAAGWEGDRRCQSERARGSCLAAAGNRRNRFSRNDCACHVPCTATPPFPHPKPPDNPSASPFQHALKAKKKKNSSLWGKRARPIQQKPMVE